MNWRLAVPELQAVLRDSRAPLLIAGSEFSAIAAEVAGGSSSIREVILVGSEGGDGYERRLAAAKQIDQEIDADENAGNQQQVGGHDRNVGVLHRLQEHQTHSGPLEHRLGNNGEGYDRSELEPGNGDHRDQSILQRVAEMDRAVAQAARARELDEIGPQHFEHFRAY